MNVSRAKVTLYLTECKIFRYSLPALKLQTNLQKFIVPQKVHLYLLHKDCFKEYLSIGSCCPTYVYYSAYKQMGDMEFYG